MKTHLSLTGSLLYFLFFVFPLCGQQLDLELKVLDLEDSPAFEKNVDQTFISGDQVYIITAYSGDYDLLVFDGEDKTFIIEDSEVDLEILGELNGGILVLIGNIVTSYSLYNLDPANLTLTLIYELPHNFKSITFLEDIALFLTWNDVLCSTDGTPGGSQLVKQFSDIPQDEELQQQVNGIVILEADNQLWRSDGTIAGTFQLSDDAPWPFHDFAETEEYVFYPVNDVLWRTDGTVSGTIALDDIGTTFNDIDHLISTENGLLFMGQTAEYGKELWFSDGTNAGTQLVKDISAGPDDGFDEGFQSFITMDNLTVFRGAGNHNWEVWKSDGTANGTIPIIDFTGQAGYNDFSLFGFLTTEDEKLFFLTRNNLNVVVLWTYDNSMTQAVQVATLPYLFHEAYSSGSKLYFETDQLWVSDGTPDGTLPLGAFTSPEIIGTHNDQLFFTYNASSQGYGREPHVTDGTVEGTGLLKDINEGIGWSEPGSFFVFNNTCYFYAEDHIAGQSFYTTDGTESGTQIAFDLYPTTLGSDLENLTNAAGKLYFIKDDMLWVSDGTTSGSLNLQHALNSLDVFGEINGKMLFISGNDLWVTDGTLSGTQLLLTDEISSFSLNPSVKMGDKLWFFYADGNNGMELYQSDGTFDGTTPAFESVPGSGSLFDFEWDSSSLGTNGERLFFTNRSPDNGLEPWTSDGTLAGTFLLKDLSNDIYSSYPNYYIRFGNRIVFNGASRLWVSDGTEEGTIELADILMYSDAPTAILGDNLIFKSQNNRLWKTDGTAEGTQLLVDPDDFIFGMVPYKNKIIFYGEEPWITDGTPEGTYILKDINLNNDSNPNFFAEVEDLMIFTAREINTRALWQTDGTEMGTILATNLDNSELRDPASLTLYRGKLYFTGYGSDFGEEIYYFDLNQSENIKGQIFHDSNADGQQSIDESGVNNIPVAAYNGEEVISYTDGEGNYEFFGLEGEYEVYPYLDQCWEVSTAPSYSVEVGSELIAGLDFGLEKVSSAASVRAQINAAPTRCGFTVPFWLNIANNGCDTISGEVVVELDELVGFVSANIPPNSVDGNTYTWHFNDIHVSEVYQIQFDLQMPDEQSVGESISLSANAFLLNNDNELILADEGSYSSTIRCAIDPNDKLVMPNRTALSDENYTLFEEKMTYTVRFQNTGTDTAFTVKIRDTLSPLLDLQTFVPIVASHPFRTTIYPGRIVEFLFENILLPDSTVNEPKSHGFVIFQINPIEGLEEFSEINNTAHIYFDYNGAVVTNTVTNTLVSTFDHDNDGFNLWEDCDDFDNEINPDAVEIPGNGIDENCDGEILTHTTETELSAVNIFPNPTSNHLRIEVEKRLDFNLNLSNPNGQVLLQQGFNTSIDLSLSNFPSGIYLLKIVNVESGARMIKKIIKID